MDEARVELALLEEKAQQLLKQLLDVRAAIATQRAKIDALSRTSLRQSTFDHLPTEILVILASALIIALSVGGRNWECMSALARCHTTNPMLLVNHQCAIRRLLDIRPSGKEPRNPP